MNAPCPNWMESIDLDAAGWLSPQEKASLNRHLTECPACASAHQKSQNLAAGLRAAAPVLEFVPDKVPTRKGSGAFLPWALALAACLAVVFLLPRDGKRPTLRSKPPPPTWLAYNLSLAEEQGLENLLDRHAKSIQLGKPQTVLLALQTRNLDEVLP
jgi:hypothetical protein